jgi:hypothetical protein
MKYLKRVSNNTYRTALEMKNHQEVYILYAKIELNRLRIQSYVPSNKKKEDQ